MLLQLLMRALCFKVGFKVTLGIILGCGLGVIPAVKDASNYSVLHQSLALALPRFSPFLPLASHHKPLD